ncbi:MAG: CPBP family intramembrane glutamic endopeptidase [Pseudomonadota bacterium]
MATRRAFSYFDAVAWTVLLALALVVAIDLVRSLAPRAAENLALAGAVQVALYAVASLLLVRRPPGGADVTRAEALGVRAPESAAIVVAALALGVLLHGPAGVVQALVEQVAPTPENELVERVRRLRPEGAFDRAALVLLVVGLAPFVEELFFRGALHARLSESHRPVGVGLVIALCFTVNHLDPRIWPALLLVALSLAVVRAKSRSIVPCFLLHASFNATTLAVVLTSADPVRAQAETPSWAAGGIATVLVGVLLAWVARSQRGVSP